MGCGHECCEIPDNGYHVHADPPGNCRRCGTYQPPPPVSLSRILASALGSIAPEIPRLPDTEPARTDLVTQVALDQYAAACDDPMVMAIEDERLRHLAVAGRIGVLLAFPALTRDRSRDTASAPQENLGRDRAG